MVLCKINILQHLIIHLCLICRDCHKLRNHSERKRKLRNDSERIFKSSLSNFLSRKLDKELLNMRSESFRKFLLRSESFRNLFFYYFFRTKINTITRHQIIKYTFIFPQQTIFKKCLTMQMRIINISNRIIFK